MNTFSIPAAKLASQKPKVHYITKSITNAIEKSNYEAVNLWCHLGHANTREDKGLYRTPLATAVDQGNEEMVQLLLTHRYPARVDENAYQLTGDQAQLLELPNYLDFFKDQRLGISKRQKNPTALDLAICKVSASCSRDTKHYYLEKYTNIVKLLLVYGANPNGSGNGYRKRLLRRPSPLATAIGCFTMPALIRGWHGPRIITPIGEKIGLALLHCGACSFTALDELLEEEFFPTAKALTLHAMHRKIKPIAMLQITQTISLPRELPNLIAEYLWPTSWGNNNQVFSYLIGSRKKKRKTYQEYLAKKKLLTTVLE